MAAEPRKTAAFAISALAWAAALYLLALLAGYYLNLWNVRRHHLEAAAFVWLAAALAAAGFGAARRSDAPQSATSAFPTTPALVCGVLVVLAYLLLAGGLGLFADDYVILEAAREGRLTVWDDLFRPAVFAIWRVLAALTSTPALLLHASNVLLHVVNAGLVCVLATRVGLPQREAFFAGALFAVFPAAVEPVVWPSGIQDVLMTTSVLGYLVLILRPDADRVHRALAVALLGIALVTKETAIVAPALAGILALATGASRRTWGSIAFTAVGVGIFLAIRFSVIPLPAGYEVPLTRYFVKEILVRPFAAFTVPLRSSAGPWHFLAALTMSAGLVIALQAAGSRWRWRDRELHLTLASAAFVLVSIAPAAAYLEVTPDLHGSRYLYLGAGAWTILLVIVVRAAWGSHSPAAVWCLIAICACWTLATGANLLAWRHAAVERDRILAAAGRAGLEDCNAWAVFGLPSVVDGVPIFLNGFPEAMRAAGRKETFRVASDRVNPGECRLRWSGADFRRE